MSSNEDSDKGYREKISAEDNDKQAKYLKSLGIKTVTPGGSLKKKKARRRRG